MKKISSYAALFVAFAMACTSLISCNKDDDDSVSPDVLIGTWNQISYECWWDYGEGEEGHEKIICDGVKDWCTITFNADGTWVEQFAESDKGSKTYTNTGWWKVVKNRLYRSKERPIDDDVIKDMNGDGEYCILSISGDTWTCVDEEKDAEGWEKEVEIYKKQ